MSAALKYIYMEDFAPGQKYTAGPVTITEEEIIAYGKQFDPQDFHTDPVRAKDTVVGELIASGWHTAGLTMRMIFDAFPQMKGGMIGRSVEKVEWPRPVRPGDRLFLDCEILDVRASKSNPQRGIIRVKCLTLNQRRETAMTMETVIFVPRK